MSRLPSFKFPSPYYFSMLHPILHRHPSCQLPQIPRITTWSIIVLFFMALGLPWCGLDPGYSTISLKFHLTYQLPCPLKVKNIECMLRHNTLHPRCVKFKNRRSRHQLQCALRQCRHQIKGWKPLPLPAPNILAQLPNQTLCSDNNSS